MNKGLILGILFLLLPVLDVWGAGRVGETAGRGSQPSAARSFASAPSHSEVSRPSPQAARAPVVINISHSASGRYNRNFPSRPSNSNRPSNSPSSSGSQPFASNRLNRPSNYSQPSYGHFKNWNSTAPSQESNAIPENASLEVSTVPIVSRPSIEPYTQQGMRAGVVIHHHPYYPGYVRVKLKKMGVTSEPELITDRSQMIDTDESHSTIQYPREGLNEQPITATVVSPQDFNDPVVRNQMMILDSPEWMGRADEDNSTETQTGHYYWHNTVGVTYCHYLDSSGYNWYGWYLGGQYFWVRYFDGRWWFCDSNLGRWCFYNNGDWWWQDPYHVGDLYYYDDNTYIPCNSADDQVVVTASNTDPMNSYASPDGTRIVKIDQVTQDAFLYDAANPPAFAPVYLATGVESVQFSNPQNGRPLEILLKLNDGSFDMFDAQGNAFDPGSLSDNESATQGEAPPAPPPTQNNS